METADHPNRHSIAGLLPAKEGLWVLTSNRFIAYLEVYVLAPSLSAATS